MCLFAVCANASLLSIYIQNDILKSDRSYTHGTRVEYNCESNGFAIGQYMYTPEDLRATNIIYGDRPYCGLAYLSLFREHYTSNSFDYLELQLGAIGDYSFAEETQKIVHKLIGSTFPSGWDNQIANEIGVNLYYQKRHRIDIFKGFLDFSPSGGVGFGNMYIGADIGVLFRLGYNLPESPNLKQIEPAILSKSRPRFHFYIFSDMDTRFVFHNITLDGSLFENPSVYTVDTKPCVVDFEHGACLGFWDFDLKASFVNRTDEFYEQEYQQGFFSIVFSFEY